MPIYGRTSPLQFINEQKQIQNLSEAEILRRAGLAPNSLTNMRKDNRRGVHMETMLAIVNALGFDIVPVKAEQP